MLLAAGLGTRMLPLSDGIAKPALPVLDVPVVLRMVRRLAIQGVTEVAINVHAFSETLREALVEAPIPVSLFAEPELRGSGGGIQGARSFLGGSDPFLILNADMCLDIELSDLLRSHHQSGALATLALRDDPRKQEFGTIGYDAEGSVRRITTLVDRGGEKACGLFIGVQVMENQIFDRMPDRAVFQLMQDVYLPALEDGELLHVWEQPLSATWWPVGSPRELLDANLLALEQCPEHERIAPDARIEGELRGPVWVGAGASIATGATVGPHAVIGRGTRVAENARVETSLSLPNSRIGAESTLVRCVAHDDRVWRDA